MEQMAGRCLGCPWRAVLSATMCQLPWPTGQGDGPLATGLSHRPADLTNRFHTAPGEGDGYLFWRISEGGMVSPFREMESAMPPFKHLNEQDRWTILTYVHHAFHGGFPKSHMEDVEGHEHEAHEHKH